ncbi:MAG: glutamine synthetase beta-grasp domain-containing protein [Altererythrobacter sp.]
MAKAKDIVKQIKDEGIEWVDLRFTDPKGKWQHLQMCAGVMDEDALEEGLMFDGSSIEGWKAINESDMILKPDLEAVYPDPFSATPMLAICCDIVEPSDGQLYSRDPRSTAKRAEAYLNSTGIGDTVYVGPEPEFFMFDDVRFEDGYAGSGYAIDDIELPTNTGKEYESGNMGHRPRAKGGYFPVAPVDSAMDIRAEMVATMLEMGLPMDKHHHEVAAAQHELGITFGKLVTTADRVQVYKYVVQQVAHAYGKTATFMPKPIKEDNGSACTPTCRSGRMARTLLPANGYAGLSDTCLYYIGGVIKHAKAINAFSNPTTNSYKRLVPGFEARSCWPIRPATARHRAASLTVQAKRRSVEFHFPDPLANPLPVVGSPADGRYRRASRTRSTRAKRWTRTSTTCRRTRRSPDRLRILREALEALGKDHEFLLKGDVLEGPDRRLCGTQVEEVMRTETTPCPVEFDMCHSA